MVVLALVLVVLGGAMVASGLYGIVYAVKGIGACNKMMERYR